MEKRMRFQKQNLDSKDYKTIENSAKLLKVGALALIGIASIKKYRLEIWKEISKICKR